MIKDDEPRLVARILDLACRFGRYGYRRITALLRMEGWRVNFKRVERIWRREGLKVPAKQPKRARLWLNDGSCIRLSSDGIPYELARHVVLRGGAGWVRGSRAKPALELAEA